jgi:hypothetical protein
VLPPLAGRPIRVVIKQSLGAHVAAASIRTRTIYLDSSVLRARGEFERILIHELFHFAWVRLSNRTRRGWEQVLAGELRAQTKGELGWSAEWRKMELVRADVRLRSPKWRRYACESFCDSAAWLYAGLARHEEFTLPRAARVKRRQWFSGYIGAGAPVRV